MINAFEVLFAIVGLFIPILIIGGIVYFILRLRGGIAMRFSYHDALRVYFYVMLLASLGLGTLGGASTLIKVGFGEVVGKEFSYGKVYEEHRSIQEHPDQQPYSGDAEDGDSSLDEKIEFAMKTSLINGVSLGSVGLFLWLVHFFGRRWVETKDQDPDLLGRLYLIGALTIFAIITIFSLSESIPETLHYALLDIGHAEESPGESLSIAIVALPIWLFYLVSAVQNIKSTSVKDS